MASLIARLPDLSVLRGDQSALVAGLTSLADQVPGDGTELLADLTSILSRLQQTSPGSLRLSTGELKVSLDGLSAKLPSPELPELSTVTAGVSSAFDVLAPAKQVLDSGDGLRHVRDLVLERMGDPDVILRDIVEGLKDAIPVESIEVLRGLIETIRNFEAGIPTDPAQIGAFLARSFLGIPVDLLSGPLDLVQGFDARIAGLVDPGAIDGWKVDIGQLVAQLRSSRDLLVSLNIGDSATLADLSASMEAAKLGLNSVGQSFSQISGQFETALGGLDLAGLVGSLKTSFGEIPEIKVAKVDDFFSLVLEPIRRINAKLDGLSAADLRAMLEAASGRYDTMIEGLGFDQIKASFLRPYVMVGNSIEKLELGPISDVISEVLGGLDSAMQAATAPVTAVRDVVQELAAGVGDALGAVSGASASVQASISQVTGAVRAAVDAVPLGAFRDSIEVALGQVESVLGEVEPVAGRIRSSVDAVAAKLDAFDIRGPAGDAVSLMSSIRDVLVSIDVSLVVGDVSVSLQASAAPLKALDLSGVFDQLRAAFDAVDPTPVLDGLRDQLDPLQLQLGDYQPAALLEPLNAPFNEALGALSSVNPGALLDPVIEQLQGLQAQLNELSASLDELIEPLRSAHIKLREALLPWSPEVLLAPLNEVFADLMELVDKLDISEFLDDLEGMFTQWLERGLSGLQGMGSAFEGAADLKSFLDPLAGSADEPELGFRPGDVLRPAQQLFAKIMQLLDQVEDSALLQAFESVRQQLVGALGQLSQVGLAAQIDRKVRAQLDSLDFVKQFDLVSELHSAYSDLVGAFHGVDRSGASPEATVELDGVGQLVIEVDPEGVLGPARAALASLRGAIPGSLDLGDGPALAAASGKVLSKVRALVPEFLQRELTLEALREALGQFDPARIAAEVNAEYDRFLLKVSALAEGLVEGLPKLGGSLQVGVVAFFPRLLKEAFAEVFDPLRAKLEELNPATLLAQIGNAVYEPLLEAVDALDPQVWFGALQESGLDSLTASLEGVMGELEGLKASLSAEWSALLEDLSNLNPALIAARAQETVVRVEGVLGLLDLSDPLQKLGDSATRIIDDLGAAVEEVQGAYDEMIDSIPE